MMLVRLNAAIDRWIEDNLTAWVLPTAARAVFAGVLLMYFWNSGLTKIGEGLFGFIMLDFGVYTQMFPKAIEAAGYDLSALPWYYYWIALFGTWSEFILPLLVVVGLLTRLAALGMLGFVAVQTYVDITGHLAGREDAAQTIGAWFDRIQDSAIMDQRAFWVLLLVILVIRGAGPISLDGLIRMQFGRAPQAAEA